MNYNTGAYNKPLNYSSIPFGNYNLGKYNSGSSYDQQFFPTYAERIFDIFVTQGIRYTNFFTVKDTSGKHINLSGCTFSGSLHTHYGSQPTANLVVYPIDIKAGKVALSMGAGVTEKLEKTRYVFHIDVTNSGGSFNVLHGQALITNR